MKPFIESIDSMLLLEHSNSQIPLRIDRAYGLPSHCSTLCLPPTPTAEPMHSIFSTINQNLIIT
ncbi:hypothetical protein ASPTUDRAFT_785581 [Aspergillus tubingensis CBS 134.48]|uniref:Uncharacterized protein n=1 Tax=Aspergillus tubingensis (strain CBS 134.48) TaxID=767770 RepID=A0A1L9MUW1_ASPTC|nr:hypothetical protein ASPTUDRAFT_785581 [Aspergillus tubingensis CBS 134.48]